ncbi:ATP-binding cassette domain-containing protein [Patulibacter defluvii]|uniref:ATP-binding cassette domain-containing protein n=1 Tax=Patulibacter defluvii TaxID=3095358 RepID=UPI002A748FA0|nr:ATP-binding cassette domain-containing protein [Patulibacter sp. DM4]
MRTLLPAPTPRAVPDAPVWQAAPPPLQLRRVRHRTRGAAAGLDAVDLTFGPAELVALHGPAGAGKTTLLRIAAGLQRPGGGQVLVAGEDLDGLGPGRRERLRRHHLALVPAQPACRSLLGPLQRLEAELARALALRPAVLLVDEPAGGFDDETGPALLERLARLRDDEGLTAVVATTDGALAARAPRRIRLRAGRVLPGDG